MSLHKVTFHELASQQNHPRQFVQVLCTSDVQLFETSRSTTKFSQPKLKETYCSQLGELTFQFLFFVKVTAWQVEIKA